MFLALYQPQVPPNTGNIGRLCVGMGVELHIIGPCAFDFSDKALRLAPVRRRFPVDRALERPAGENQLARDLPYRRPSAGWQLEPVEDRQQKRQPVTLVGGRLQDGARGGSPGTGMIFMKGTERGERERHRAVSPDDIAPAVTIIRYQYTVARLLTCEHQMTTGFGPDLHKDRALAKRRLERAAAFG